MLPLWELWATLDKLLPFDRKEQDLTYILERQKNEKPHYDSEQVYASFADFPADVVCLLGLGQETPQSEEPPKGERDGSEQVKRGDLTNCMEVPLPQGVKERIRACKSPTELAEVIRFLLYIGIFVLFTWASRLIRGLLFFLNIQSPTCRGQKNSRLLIPFRKKS